MHMKDERIHFTDFKFRFSLQNFNGALPFQNCMEYLCLTTKIWHISLFFFPSIKLRRILKTIRHSKKKFYKK